MMVAILGAGDDVTMGSRESAKARAELGWTAIGIEGARLLWSLSSTAWAEAAGSMPSSSFDGSGRPSSGERAPEPASPLPGALRAGSRARAARAAWR